jgi:transportin-3
MAANGSANSSYGPVLAALNSLQSNVDREQKAKAHEFLEKFQKSVSSTFFEIPGLEKNI